MNEKKKMTIGLNTFHLISKTIGVKVSDVIKNYLSSVKKRMEITNNPLPPEKRQFLQEMSQYVGCKLYFYGSIQRLDYFPEDSDIDIDMFSENVTSTLSRLQTFLKLEKSKIKRIVMYLDSTFITGYKMMYVNDSLNLKCEISLYSEEHKHIVLKEHLKKTTLPFYALWMMILLKCMYYKLKVIDFKQYRSIKHYMLSIMIGFQETYYLVMK